MKSQAIPERLGFTRGMLRDNELLNGIYSSSYIYSLLKSEYNSNNKLDLQKSDDI